MKLRILTAALLLCAYLGLHNGYLALFRGDDKTPQRIFPYRAALYPQIDQGALEIGIPVNDPDQLKQRLEDFLS